jgi:hypothetical protein
MSLKARLLELHAQESVLLDKVAECKEEQRFIRNRLAMQQSDQHQRIGYGAGRGVEQDLTVRPLLTLVKG